MNFQTHSAMCIVSLYCIPVIGVWLATEPLLKLCQQDPHISHMAAEYVRLLLPGFWFNMMFDTLKRSLQTQGIVFPIMVC